MPKYTCPQCDAQLEYGTIRELQEFLPVHEKSHTKTTIKPKAPQEIRAIFCCDPDEYELCR